MKEEDLRSYHKEKAGNNGDHKAEIFKNEQDVPVLYVKSTEKHNGKSDPKTSIFLEVLAYRFVKKFLPNQVSAETNFFETLKGEFRIASSWIDNYIPIYDVGLPYAMNDAFRVNINGEPRILRGNFFQNLLLMRLIGLGDSIGKGANTGYVLNEDGSVTLAQIDFGGGFAFANYEDYNPFNHLALNIIQRLNKKYLEEAKNDPDYITFIPLEMYHPQGENLIRDELKSERKFLELYHEGYSIKDLLLGFYSYDEIKQDEFLYAQFLKALSSILNIVPEDLLRLVKEDMPDFIEEEELQTLKDNISSEITSRLAVIRQIYSEDYQGDCNVLLEFSLMNGSEIRSAHRSLEGMIFNQFSWLEKKTGNNIEEIDYFADELNVSSDSNFDIDYFDKDYGLASYLSHLLEVLEDSLMEPESDVFYSIFEDIVFLGGYTYL